MKCYDLLAQGSLEVKRPTMKIREGKEPEERRCMCMKRRQVVKHYVFPMFCGPGESKSRRAKAAGVKPLGQMRDQKVHAAVARSACRNKHAKDTPLYTIVGTLLEVEMFKKGSGAKRVSKFKCAKRPSFEAFLEV